MYYEFNISKEGKHLFATAPRSCQTYLQARALFALLSKRFPAEDDFEIICNQYLEQGTLIPEFSDKER